MDSLGAFINLKYIMWSWWIYFSYVFKNFAISFILKIISCSSSVIPKQDYNDKMEDSTAQKMD